MRRPEPLARALKGALRGLNLDQRMRESQAMALWPDIVGDVTAGKTRPLYVNRGTLVVQVASSAWAHQLSLLKPRLLALIEERVGPGVIRDLRMKSGTEPEPDAPAEMPEPRRKRGRADETPLPADEQEQIARQARGVEDPMLQDRLRKLLIANARRKHRLRAAGWEACQRCGCLHDAEADAKNAAPGPLANAPLCPVCRLELQPLVTPVP
ncbi:MAG: hypothetical protein JWM80_53 [Cyanobacteria bacterium RYN_339]|nr:hypothetical protein [Cyanobacteria bacterium RYN_339]